MMSVDESLLCSFQVLHPLKSRTKANGKRFWNRRRKSKNMSMAAWAPADLSLHRGKSKREERTPVKLRTTRYTKRHFAFAPFLQTGKDWVTGDCIIIYSQEIFYIWRTQRKWGGGPRWWRRRWRRRWKHIAIWGIFGRKHILCKNGIFKSCEQETTVGKRLRCEEMRIWRQPKRDEKALLFCSVREKCVR
jgi:hypothetical protein